MNSSGFEAIADQRLFLQTARLEISSNSRR
jgi:hypothetical protein